MTRKVMVGPRSGDASYSAGGLASGSQPLGPTAKAWTVPPRPGAVGQPLLQVVSNSVPGGRLYLSLGSLAN